MAENTIGEAFIAIRATFDQLTKDMQQAQSKIEQATKPIQEKFQSIGKAVGNAGKDMTKWVTGPIVAVGGGLMMLVSKTAAAGDEIQKMALRTGFSTEALSEYKHAAELSGTSLDAIETSVKRMQRTLLDAEQGSKTATDSLEALGLSVQDLKGLSPEQQFDKLAMAIASIEDPSRRAALAQEIFGRSGTDLLPMLAAGADGIAQMRQEARDLGIVWSQDAADAAAKFNDDMDRLKKAFSGVFMEVGQKLLPVFTEQLIPAIKENIIPLVKQFGEKISGLIKWFAELSPTWQKIILGALGLAAALGPVLLILGPIISAIGTLIGILPALGAAFTALTGPIGLVVLAIAGAVAIGIYLYKNWDEIKEKIITLWESFSRWFANLWEGIKESLRGIWQKIKDVFWGAVNEVDSKVRTAFDLLGRFIRDTWNSISTFFGTFWNKVKTTFWEGIEAIVQWFRDLPGRVFQHVTNFVNGVVERFTGLFKKLVGGSIVPDMMEQIQSVITVGMDGTATVIEKGTEAWEKLFGEGAKKSVGTVEKELGKLPGVVANITAAAQRAVEAFTPTPWAPSSARPEAGQVLTLHQAAVITSPEFKAMSPAGQKGLMESLGIKTLQAGGVVTRPTLSLIGEAGPEAVIPLNRILDRIDQTAKHLTIIVEMDGRQVARAALPYIPSELVRVGVR